VCFCVFLSSASLFITGLVILEIFIHHKMIEAKKIQEKNKKNKENQ